MKRNILLSAALSLITSTVTSLSYSTALADSGKSEEPKVSIDMQTIGKLVFDTHVETVVSLLGTHKTPVDAKVSGEIPLSLVVDAEGKIKAFAVSTSEGSQISYDSAAPKVSKGIAVFPLVLAGIKEIETVKTRNASYQMKSQKIPIKLPDVGEVASFDVSHVDPEKGGEVVLGTLTSLSGWRAIGLGGLNKQSFYLKPIIKDGRKTWVATKTKNGNDVVDRIELKFLKEKNEFTVPVASKSSADSEVCVRCLLNASVTNAFNSCSYAEVYKGTNGVTNCKVTSDLADLTKHIVNVGIVTLPAAKDKSN